MEKVSTKDFIKNIYGAESPLRIAEELGVIVTYHSLGKCPGYYMTQGGVHIICVNADSDRIIQEQVIFQGLEYYFLYNEQKKAAQAVHFIADIQTEERRFS